MAEAVLSTSLNTLRDLLIGEAEFLSGVSDRVEEIQRELEMMKCFLRDADKRQHREERVRNWIREVKDLCYQVEDVLETFAVEAASKRSGQGIKKIVKRLASLPSEALALHKVGSRLARIQNRLSRLRTSLQTYGLQELPADGESSKEANEKQRRLRQTYAHEVEAHFVGMEDEISKLVSEVVNENKKGHRVISIYGMGGLGKTTLARKIYDHSKIKHCFEAFAWHCISQQYDFKLVLRDILKQLVGKTNAMEEEELVRELYNVQRQKKCFIVLDDVWEIDDWRVLSKAFPIADQGASSKILLTTRKKDVAENGYPHESRNLNKEESWQLFQKIAFLGQKEKDVKRDPQLESVGREVVDKCGGLPLAISVLGGILKSRNTLSEWKIVSKDVDLYLSEGDGSKQGCTGSPIDVLALSYNDLPYHLKSCFLYMGIFREDEEIKARKLFHLWIAEGMVSSKHRGSEETVMDVAERYLYELASRSMVQVEMDNIFPVKRIESCKLHDLMRDLCLNKGKEEGFLENVNKDDDDGGPSSFSDRKAHRLAICSNMGRVRIPFLLRKVHLPLEQITNQFLRALFVRCANLHGEPNFRSCRVVDFERCSFHEGKLPKQVSKMIHLRFLSVMGCSLDTLPLFIGDLQYLETLDLRTSSTLYLPNNIFSNMKSLRDLYLRNFHCGLRKLQLNGLSGLESLVGFDSETCRHKDLSELVNLQYFDGVLRSDDWSLIIDHIDSWRRTKWVKIVIGPCNLEQTHFGKLLTCRNLNDLELDASRIGKLPRYEPSFWPNLIRLYLWGTEIDEDSMEVLKKLPKLRKLSLGWNAFIGEEFIFDPTDFIRLISLELREQPNLKRWRMAKGAMPNLSRLIVHSRMKFEIIPEDGLRYLTNLKEFRHIYGNFCSSDFSTLSY